jgi:hypothetical protein
VTDAAGPLAALLYTMVSGLRQLPAGPYGCPSEADEPMLLTSMQLTFRTALGGPVVATAGADYVGCQFAWVTVGTQTVWPLDENTGSGQSLQQQVLAIAGVSWPYPPG